MSSGSTVPDPDPELINAQNFNFAKPKLFFKNIGKYAATSTYIHVRIPFPLEDFRDIIKALPQKTEISMPGRPK